MQKLLRLVAKAAAVLHLVVSERLPGWERFAGYQTVSINASINKDAAYEDNLVFKF